MAKSIKKKDDNVIDGGLYIIYNIVELDDENDKKVKVKIQEDILTKADVERLIFESQRNLDNYTEILTEIIKLEE